jgi:hypothetical protein
MGIYDMTVQELKNLLEWLPGSDDLTQVVVNIPPGKYDFINGTLSVDRLERTPAWTVGPYTGSPKLYLICDLK